MDQITKVDIEDLALLMDLIRKSELSNLQAALLAEKLENAKLKILAKYKLGEKDSFNLTDGLICRG